jgi:hypothetical protein
MFRYKQVLLSAVCIVLGDYCVEQLGWLPTSVSTVFVPAVEMNERVGGSAFQR